MSKPGFWKCKTRVLIRSTNCKAKVETKAHDNIAQRLSPVGCWGAFVFWGGFQPPSKPPSAHLCICHKLHCATYLQATRLLGHLHSFMPRYKPVGSTISSHCGLFPHVGFISWLYDHLWTTLFYSHYLTVAFYCDILC